MVEPGALHERSSPSGLVFLRLFLAVWPPAEVRDALVEHTARWQWPQAARTTRPERLHLTLHFIGDVDESRVDVLKQALATDAPPFTLSLQHTDVWRGGIAVLQPDQVPAELSALHARLGERLRALALPVEDRPWRAHVTLARKAQGAVAPASPADVVWHAEPGYALVRSLPGGRGYETLQRFG
jgi:RNA 2',3'-cyclic 3'-phosphodiesterase